MSTANTLLSPAGQLILKTIDDRIEEYIKKMAPGVRVSETDGAFQQRQLWFGIVFALLNQNPDVFVEGWGRFLKVVNENIGTSKQPGVFHPAYLNRFQGSVKLLATERRNLERMMHLATTTADPRRRVLSMKQLDMNAILVQLPSEEMRQKVIAFYQL